LANPEHLAKLLNPIKVWNEWRQCDLVTLDLSGANLSRADLRGADLRGADLREVDFREANLHNANFEGTDLTHAHFGATSFGDTNLKDARGLESCTHTGQSFLDYKTIKGHGPLPDKFLVGCGIPKALIDYLKNLSPISCFISHSSDDREFAEHLSDALHAKDVPNWFAPRDIQAAKKIVDQIQDAISRRETTVLVLSRASMKSAWVEREIAWTLKAGHLLCPISLVRVPTILKMIQKWKTLDDDGKYLADEIQQYHIPDFSDWTNSASFRKAVERLVSDLQKRTRSPLCNLALLRRQFITLQPCTWCIWEAYRPGHAVPTRVPFLSVLGLEDCRPLDVRTAPFQHLNHWFDF